MAKTRSLAPFFSFKSPFLWEEEDWPEVATGGDLDVYETDNEVVVKAPVPGIKAEEVDVTFEDGVLRISAKHEEKEEEKKKKKVVYQAQRTRQFNYTTTLPRAVDSNNLSAEVEDGVVIVTAPLTAEAKPRKVKVNTKK